MNNFDQHRNEEQRRDDFVHYDEITCLQYLEGLLDRPKALELSAHTAHCPGCRALLHALEHETRMLSNALREQEEAVPERLLAGPVRDRTPWAWVGAFGMAAAGAYWLWTAIIDPWSDQLSQAGFGGTDLMTMLFFHGAFWKGWDSVLSMMQALALISLTVIGFLLLRRSLRRWNTIALVMGALLAALGLPFGVHAAEVHRNEANYTLPADAVVKNDLIVSGNSIHIEGTVDGDLIVFGGSVTVDGHVTGDVIAFTNMLQINGAVDGNVRDFSRQISVRGKVGKNLTAFAETIEADSQSQIGWSATLVGGDVSLNGRIGRDILGYTGQLDLNGFVGGNTDLKTSETFTIGSQAQTLGKIRYTGPAQPAISIGARLASPVETTIAVHKADLVAAMNFWHKLLYWGSAFIFGLVLLLITPGFFAETVRSANRFGVSLGIGALVSIATPVIAVLACITIVGLGVGISTLLLWAIAWYSAKIFIAAWLGQRILGKNSFAGIAIGQKMWPVPHKGAMIGQFALGLVLLDALRMIPYVGLCIGIVVQIWGFGAAAVTLYHRMRSTPEIAPA
jgi:cytoskeletal protein CcmA (bactofilin family)